MVTDTGNEKQNLDPSQFRPERLTGGRPTDLGDMALAHKAAQLAEVFQGRLPSARELANISEELGIEMATAILHRVIIDSPVHGEIMKRMRAIDPADPMERLPIQSKIEIAIVSSNLFRSHRKWGDHVETWRKWARETGFTTDVIETESKLSVSENARVIREHLLRNPHPNRFVVTYGQGASEFRFLLQKLHLSGVNEALEGIKGWINVCGSFAGSGLSQFHDSTTAKRFFEKLEMRIAKRNPVTLAQTSSDFAMWRQPLAMPQEMMVANIIGLPLADQVPLKLKLSFEELAKTSPNDGVVRFWDSVAAGFVIPVVGMSHQVPDSQLKPVFLRTLMLLAASLDEKAKKNSEVLPPSLEFV